MLWFGILLPLVSFFWARRVGARPHGIYLYGAVATIALALVGWLLGFLL